MGARPALSFLKMQVVEIEQSSATIYNLLKMKLIFDTDWPIYVYILGHMGLMTV